MFLLESGISSKPTPLAAKKKNNDIKLPDADNSHRGTFSCPCFSSPKEKKRDSAWSILVVGSTVPATWTCRGEMGLKKLWENGLGSACGWSCHLSMASSDRPFSIITCLALHTHSLRCELYVETWVRNIDQNPFINCTIPFSMFQQRHLGAWITGSGYALTWQFLWVALCCIDDVSSYCTTVATQ